MVADIKSERWPASRRNGWPASVGIRTNGELKESRPVGSYVAGRAGGEPHTEGGGDQDVIVYFTNRDIAGPVYEILDEHHAVVATFGIPEFKALYEAQISRAA